MEQIQSLTFKEAGFQARNAEEALLVALNACARETKEVSSYNCPDTQTFGAWFKRIQGQRDGAESVLAADCLSYLDLSDSYLHMGDFYGANFNSSKLRRVLANFANFYHANLRDADLESAFLGHSSFERAFLEGANLKDARCEHAIFKNAFLKNANFEKAHLISAEFDDASGREFAIFDPAPKRRRKSKA